MKTIGNRDSHMAFGNKVMIMKHICVLFSKVIIMKCILAGHFSDNKSIQYYLCVFIISCLIVHVYNF